MLRRVRWGNVGRLACAVVALALVVLWPRLATPPPGVPGGAAVPVAPGAGVTPEAVEPAGDVAGGNAEDAAGRGAPEAVPRPPPRRRHGGAGNGDRVGKRDRPLPGARAAEQVAAAEAPDAADAPAIPPAQAPPPTPAPPTATPTSAPPPETAPPPAPTIDPAEREFGFEG
jgi:hypothetical protein